MNSRLLWKTATTERKHELSRRRDVVTPEERRLIDEAVLAGRVTVVPKGVVGEATYALHPGPRPMKFALHHRQGWGAGVGQG